jgi:hypothetical protein
MEYDFFPINPAYLKLLLIMVKVSLVIAFLSAFTVVNFRPHMTASFT